MLYPYEVKSNYDFGSGSSRLEKDIDQRFIYYPDDDVCFACLKFSELSDDDFTVLANYARLGYDITITGIDANPRTKKNQFLVKVSYDYKKGYL